MSPPFVKTNIKVYGLSLGAMRLFFLPDQLFVFQTGKYIAINYNRLLVDMSPTRFIEHQGVPRDSDACEEGVDRC